jgi:hypothetical protein
MANSGGWTNSQQQEMSDFDSADNFPSGDGFNIGELSGMDGTYDLVLYVLKGETIQAYAHFYCSSARTVIIY